MRFIGQNAELQQLSRFSDRSPDSLAVMYGRRRVGKSELLRQALKHSGLQYVFFECRQTSETQNLAALQATIGLQLSEPPLAFASLEGALACLLQVLRQTNRIRQPKGAGNRLESVRYLQAG